MLCQTEQEALAPPAIVSVLIAIDLKYVYAPSRLRSVNMLLLYRHIRSSYHTLYRYPIVCLSLFKPVSLFILPAEFQVPRAVNQPAAMLAFHQPMNDSRNALMRSRILQLTIFYHCMLRCQSIIHLCISVITTRKIAYRYYSHRYIL